MIARIKFFVSYYCDDVNSCKTEWTCKMSLHFCFQSKIRQYYWRFVYEKLNQDPRTRTMYRTQKQSGKQRNLFFFCVFIRFWLVSVSVFVCVVCMFFFCCCQLIGLLCVLHLWCCRGGQFYGIVQLRIVTASHCGIEHYIFFWCVLYTHCYPILHMKTNKKKNNQNLCAATHIWRIETTKKVK